ncbi:MAG: HK97 gp10 family phage protein [Clostridium sp.]
MGFQTDFLDVKSALSSLQNKVRRTTIDKALDAGAEELLKEQIDNVPVYKGDKKRRGGNLKNSLAVGNKTGRDLTRKVHVGITNAKEREVEYGYYQEFGWVSKNKAVAGKRWMKKSFIKAEKRAKETIKNVLIEELKNIKK